MLIIFLLRETVFDSLEPIQAARNATGLRKHATIVIQTAGCRGNLGAKKEIHVEWE